MQLSQRVVTNVLICKKKIPYMRLYSFNCMTPISIKADSVYKQRAAEIING